MITSNATLIWPLLILASSVLIAAAVFKFGSSLRSIKAKHMSEIKEVQLPKVDTPQASQPMHTATSSTRPTVEWDTAKSVDFGVLQGLRFGFGFGIGVFLSVIFLSMLGLWFFSGILHTFLASMPVFR